MEAGRPRRAPGRLGSLRRREFIGAGAATLLAAGAGCRSAAASTALETAVTAAIGDRPLGPEALLRLDLPDSYEFGTTIPLGIDVASPMTAAEHVRRVAVLAEGNPFPDVVTVHFTPANGRAMASSRIRLNEGIRQVVAVAELSDGRALVARRSIKVAISGCSAQSGAADVAAMPMPEPRVKLPTGMRSGEVVEIRTMISHWMETGLRRDAEGRAIPRRIINRMVCELDGEEVFAADLTPAVAANAYLTFPVIARGSGRLTLTWTEDGGAVYRAGQSLAVS